MGVIGAGEETVDMDEVWGHGEAMIGDDDLTSGQDADVDLGELDMAGTLNVVGFLHVTNSDVLV